MGARHGDRWTARPASQPVAGEGRPATRVAELFGEGVAKADSGTRAHPAATHPVDSAEDLILYKLIARRPQDLADIEHVVRRRRTELDWTYLRSWATWLADETGLPHIVGTLDAMSERFEPTP